MHVGYAPLFQNPGNALPDLEVYRQELRLAEMAEPLGFDSVWSVEHHFTDYTMCPDVVQFLSYMAGRTQRVKLGSMVVVLPWHDPVRVAEQIAMLDNLSGGRTILGLGRGLARVEYDGFRIDQGEGRNRFVEYAQLVLDALERGYIEGGEATRQPRRDIRPRPFQTFRGRTYAAAVSPESMPIMARLGIGLLVVPQKPWDVVKKDFEVYHQAFRDANDGAEAPPPFCGAFMFVDEDAGRAEEMAFQLHRRLLPLGDEALRDALRAVRHRQGLRVLQERGRLHRAPRRRRRRARLRQADAVGHARAGAREAQRSSARPST